VASVDERPKLSWAEMAQARRRQAAPGAAAGSTAPGSGVVSRSANTPSASAVPSPASSVVSTPTKRPPPAPQPSPAKGTGQTASSNHSEAGDVPASGPNPSNSASGVSSFATKLSNGFTAHQQDANGTGKRSFFGTPHYHYDRSPVALGIF
jgi:hypothetical protein